MKVLLLLFPLAAAAARDCPATLHQLGLPIPGFAQVSSRQKLSIKPNVEKYERLLFVMTSLTNCEFTQVVGHGIHSLTVQDIRNFFEPTATENNSVPTVNIQLGIFCDLA